MRWFGIVGACNTRGEWRNSYRIVVGNPEGKGPFERSSGRWGNNDKIYIKVKTDLRSFRADFSC